MAEVLDSGHVITDEDVDTARLIMDLDRALGRGTDPLTRRVAEMPASQVRAVLAQPGDGSVNVRAANGRPVAAGEALARVLTSPENAAELAREVVEQLPEDLDPADQARVVSRVTDVIRRWMIKLVAETGPGH